MRTTSLLALLTLFLSIVTVAHRSTNAIADDVAAIADADKVYLVSYRLTDMPVWSSDGKTFDPAILIALLKTTVAPNAWNTGSSMAPHGDRSCLVIATTSANHESIARVLKTLRLQLVQAKNG